VRGGYGHTAEEARAASGFLNRKWPGFVVGCPADAAGRPVVVCDIDPYRPGELSGTEAEWRSFFLDFVSMVEALTADLDELRRGAVCITQCRGMGWRNFSFEVEKRGAVLYQDALPCRFHAMPMVDAGVVFRTCLRICKVFLKKKIADRIWICDQDALYADHGFDRARLPPVLGGTSATDYAAWASAQLARRAASVAAVVVPDA
jgi:hypothetical protein